MTRSKTTPTPVGQPSAGSVDMKLEVIIIPVSDVDRRRSST